MSVVGRIAAMPASARGTPVRQTTKPVGAAHPKVRDGFLLTTNHIGESDLTFSPRDSMMPTSKSTKAKTSPPVTLKHLAAALAEEHELTKRGGEELLHGLVGLITKHLKKGERIRIAGLGILQVRKRAARMGRNPATGEAIKIKASKKVAFRAAKDLKEAV
jgi:DNA-binding protein HU-beta